MANKPQPTSAYLSVLAIQPFRFLWIGQICSQFAVNTLLFVLALRVYQTTASNTAVSGLFLSHSIPAVLFGLIAGTIVDRLDKRKILVFCDILRGIFTLSLLFASHNILVVYVVTFLNSVITQLYVPSEAPLIPKLVPASYLVSANSMFAFTFYSSLAIGSVLAGPLLRLLGPENFFVSIAMVFWCASYFSSRISTQSSGTVGVTYLVQLKPLYLIRRIWERLSEGIVYVKKSATLFDAIVLLTGTQIVLAMLGSLGPGYADKALGIDIRDASLILVGPVVLGILTGSFWVGSIGYRYDVKRLIRWGVMSAGIVLIIISLVTRALQLPHEVWLGENIRAKVIVIVLFFSLGVANSLLDVPANATLQDEARGNMRGRVYGILAAFVGGVGMVPVIFGGWLADTIGVVAVIGILGIAIVSYGLYRLRYIHTG